MKAYAQKQNQPQQQVAPNIPRSSAKSLAATPMVHSIMHVQRTIGNQAVQRLLLANAEGLDAGSDTTATTRFAHDFSRIPVHSKAPVKVQAKLKVNTPGDIYEQEADRVAEQVTSMSEPQLQRTCECGGECPKCQNEQATHERLQTKGVQANGIAEIEAPAIVNEVLRSSGQPLDRTTQGFMESRFGHDFSRVRVHTDARAAESAQAVNAIAYTVGRNIVFAPARYEPTSTQGRRLLAHELTHMVQQEERSVPSQLVVGHSKDTHGQDAEVMARGALEIPSAQHDASEVKLQRVADEEDTINTGGEGRQSAEPDCGPAPVACQICIERKPKLEAWEQTCEVVSQNGIYFYVDSTGKKCYRALDPSDLEYKRDRKCPLPYDKSKFVPGGSKTKWPGGDKKK